MFGVAAFFQPALESEVVRTYALTGFAGDEPPIEGCTSAKLGEVPATDVASAERVEQFGAAEATSASRFGANPPCYERRYFSTRGSLGRTSRRRPHRPGSAHGVLPGHSTATAADAPSTHP